MTDPWDSADGYEAYIGRWSREVAPAFLRWAKPPPGRVLDVGCGTGALSASTLDAGAREVLGIDPSAAYVAKATTSLPKRATFRVGDAQSLPFESGAFDAAVSGLVLNFVPRPEVAAAEMARVVRTGGTVAAYLWDYAGRMETIRQFWDAAVFLRPEARALDEGVRFPLCETSAMRDAFTAAGLTSVETGRVDVVAHWRSFDDWWTPFLSAQGPAPGYCMALPEPDRVKLRALLGRRLPIASDGSVALVLRALTVKGTKA